MQERASFPHSSKRSMKMKRKKREKDERQGRLTDGGAKNRQLPVDNSKFSGNDERNVYSVRVSISQDDPTSSLWYL